MDGKGDGSGWEDIKKHKGLKDRINIWPRKKVAEI